MIFLDTHVAFFLVNKETNKLPRQCQKLIEYESLWISPIALLELTYLYQNGRLKYDSSTIFSYLKTTVSLQQSQTPIDSLILAAMNIGWTRDLFDRLIVADCIVHGAKLMTRDALILEHYPQAIWD